MSSIEEQDEPSSKEISDKKEIARLSQIAAQKLKFLKDDEKSDIQAALSLLTQAMILADDREFSSQTTRLIAEARKLSR